MMFKKITPPPFFRPCSKIFKKDLLISSSSQPFFNDRYYFFGFANKRGSHPLFASSLNIAGPLSSMMNSIWLKVSRSTITACFVVFLRPYYIFWVLQSSCYHSRVYAGE